MASSALINVMVTAARKAARGLQRDFGEVENLQVSQKGPADFVTRADKKTEKFLHAELLKARPTYGFLMEESGAIEGSDGQHRWIIDPIDGTTNFIHGIPHVAMSIALQRGDEIVAGVVYNPITDELFTAERGRGAFMDNRRLQVAARRDIHDAVIGCGIPHRGRGDHAGFRDELARVQVVAAGIRRMGTASLDLAYVAAGRLDGYWERGLQPWDMAAGLLLVREARGRAGDIDGNADPLQTGNIIAANEPLLEPLRDLVKKA